MEKRSRICFVIILILLAVMARTLLEKEEKSCEEVTESYENYMATMNTEEEFNDLGIEEQHYQLKGIEVSYPKLISGAGEDRLKRWNEIIKEDVDGILAIYRPPSNQQIDLEHLGGSGDTLTLRYEIKNLGDIFSVFYRAAFFSRSSAYPTDLVYTTNLDLRKDKRLVLSDLVEVNSDFVRKFSQWKPVSVEDNPREIEDGVLAYLQGLGEEALLRGFQNADVIGSGNYLGIYSYLTPERMGISIGVPNYLGDHSEFEQDYTEFSGDLLKQP